jgi:SAM-dependent methyltransferase
VSIYQTPRGFDLNLFDGRSAAARYAKGRPYYHDQVMVRVKKHVTVPIARALDVGCGTGQSTAALREIADRIVGIDVSPQMIAEVVAGDRTEHLVASAESVPFANDSFDLVTVSSAFHWFDRELFLSEVRRVLSPDGWLVVYENWFTGRMQECPEFERWSREVYTSRYPIPPRNPPFNGTADALGAFRLVGLETYENVVAMTVEQFVDYLLTQTNVTAASESGKGNIAEIRAWIENEVEPYFRFGVKGSRSKPCHFVFRGVIWCLECRRD